MLDVLEKETLEEVIKYNDDLVPALMNIVNELREGRKEDTGELLNSIIVGVNWEIEIFNCLEDTINGRANWVDKKLVIEAVGNLGKALQAKDDELIATCLEDDFIPFVKSMEKAAVLRLEQNKESSNN